MLKKYSKPNKIMRRKKTQHIILFAVLAMTSSTIAQQIYVGLGLNRASFKEYVNSAGVNTLDNSGYGKPEESLFESGFRFKIYKQRLHFDVGLLYNKYTINTSFYSENLRIPTTYNLSYAGLKVGLTLDVIRWERVRLQAHIHASNDWLLFGTNRFRNVFIDVYKERTINRGLLNFHRGLGVEFDAFEKISLYLNYNIATSFKEGNQDSTDGEAYHLKAKAITLGLLFDVSK
jgi:hypothetical protein